VIVGIDSMILVYAGFVPSNPGKRAADFKELQFRSKVLLHQIRQRKGTIVFPTIAMSEVLVPVRKADQGALIAALTKEFVCPAFDLRAAAIAADLWSQHSRLPQDQQYGSRHVLRVDAMIVASAHAAGATEFYSHDRGCRALAGLVMTAHDLPTHAEDLFLEGDIRRGEL
jgi:predicted nucleic acid-binding protein